jgi:hypothetical protein
LGLPRIDILLSMFEIDSNHTFELRFYSDSENPHELPTLRPYNSVNSWAT